MNNKNMSVKERNLVKGALRRVFSRSDIRRRVIELTIVEHYDPKRTRVKTWCFCPIGKHFEAKSYMIVDHVIPIIGITESLEELSWDTVIDRLWCGENNLMPMCIDCHKLKTKQENSERRRAKKENKK